MTRSRRLTLILDGRFLEFQLHAFQVSDVLKYKDKRYWAFLNTEKNKI